MLDVLEKVVEKVPHHTELRYCCRDIITLRSVNKVVESDITSLEGVGVRVIVDGSLGFSSTHEVTVSSIEEAVKRAVRAARARYSAAHLAETTLARGTFHVDEHDPVTAHSLEEKVHLVTESEPLLEHPDTKVSVCGYSEFCDHKFIVTSDGALAEIYDNKLEFSLSAYIEDVQGEASCGATGGWGDLFAEEKPETLAEKAVERAQRLRTARYCKAGQYTVILDPSLVGLLAHEAVGHLCEADFVLGGAVTREMMGKKVASSLVTITDTGDTLPHACGTTLVDDEGVPARSAHLVKKGVLTGFLHDRNTAFLFGAEPTGNARAFEFDCEPLIRMRTTMVEPGEWNLEEMMDREGFLLVGSGAGEADMSGTFIFEVKEVYPFKKGELGDSLKGTSITGNAFDVLHSVDAVGKKVQCALPSMYCWKGQAMRVDGGGPYVRCSVLMGGH